VLLVTKYLLQAVQGTVAPLLLWLRVVLLERAKRGEEPLRVLKIFHSFLDF
jgi:hypothetical protein